VPAITSKPRPDLSRELYFMISSIDHSLNFSGWPTNISA
jgi:hypothetical protein